MTGKQKAILVGMILGDTFLQKTGETNARIRLEHSSRQKDYLVWKVSHFPEFFQGDFTSLSRFNSRFGKTYYYVRWQSKTSSKIGEFRKIFYDNQGRKIVPANIKSLLTDSISLAVWYMDDGYLYHRDKMIYIYLAKYTKSELDLLLQALKENFSLFPGLKIKKTGSIVLVFSVSETKKFLKLINQYIIPSLQYKLLDPVTTESDVSSDEISNDKFHGYHTPSPSIIIGG